MSTGVGVSPQGTSGDGRAQRPAPTKKIGRKALKDENWQDLAALLPKQPDGLVTESVFQAIYDDPGECVLGEHYMLYRRVSIEVAPELKRTMTAQDWAERESLTRPRWAAECKCTCCGDEFHTGWRKGGGLVMLQGDDGALWPNLDDVAGTEFLEGETITCQSCLRTVEARRWGTVRHGRTWQVLQPEIVSAGDYDGVVFWLVSRQLHPNGDDMCHIFPRDAMMVDKAGKLRRFTWDGEAWRPCATVRDPEQITYYSYEAANCRKIGGWGMEDWPEELTGTGEKTALETYAAAGGLWPGRYLLLWRKHPQVENLMRQGFNFAVTEAIDSELANAMYWQDLKETPVISWIDWGEVKPHRMLHMSREAFREIRRYNWTAESCRIWRRCERQWPKLDAREFSEWRLKVGAENVEKLADMVAAGWKELTPGKVIRYLEKQKLGSEGVGMLIDYRKMMRQERMEETEETCWPRNLTESHDRLNEVLLARRQAISDAAYLKVRETYRGLEWTDGELCVRLPVSEWELRREGDVLRHCVGSYGPSHLKGQLIFFVRKYRRPERNYYTLNIDMTGKRPKEIQLHGYGNEHHGEKKQYTHKIPRKVREFVDRWEREVLTPWWAENRAKETPKKRKKEAKTA